MLAVISVGSDARNGTGTLATGRPEEAIGGAIKLQISGNGSSWTSVRGYVSGSDLGQNSDSVDITAFAAADTRIRFVTECSSTDGLIYFDNFEIAYTYTPDTEFPTLVGADLLHAQGIDGTGVTVAVLDTGYWSHPDLDENANNQSRVLAQYDAIADQTVTAGTSNDGSGHGAHVSSIILSSAAGGDAQGYGIPTARHVGGGSGL